MSPSLPSGILVEAEDFDHYGGWVLDNQFELEMGSPYLLAHGNGKPVADATTTIEIPDAGEYNVWVRSKDWVPGHHPGTFTLAVNGSNLPTIFGSHDQDWSWEPAGKVGLPSGRISLTLIDLTGFGGRCDAMFFSLDCAAPPNGIDEAARTWRKRLRGLPDEPEHIGRFDVVIVGGGIPGIAAALAAARFGDCVALVHNRPVLGGNASNEIGLRPRGINGPLVDEIYRRRSDGDLYALQLLEAEPSVKVFLDYTMFDAVVTHSTISSVDARHGRTGREIRLSAPTFIDCSGKVIIGLHSGAETLFGQESQGDYGEGLAPTHGDQLHHGNTVFFRTRMSSSPVSFPVVPWATEVAKDFSDLRGQLTKPGFENGDGPLIGPPNQGLGPDARRRMNGPLTHYWEYGQWLDPYANGEHIRDYLLRAIYGTFYNVKTVEPEKYENLELEWVAFVAAQGEFKRYEGAHVLSEKDIREHKTFPDAVVKNDGAFCLHYPGNSKYDFRLKDWEWDERDRKPYDIPFRCLYSANVHNLMMAGKHISATHVAGSNTKFMGNGAQHAIATAAAAHLCKKYGTNPRGLCEDHMAELQSLAATVTGVNCSNRESRL